GPRGNYARYPKCKRRGFTQPGSGRRWAGRCGGEAGRYFGWKNYAEERDGTGSGGEAASRHLWRESRRCKRHVTYGSFWNVRHRDGREGVLLPRSFTRETYTGGNQTS